MTDKQRAFEEMPEIKHHTKEAAVRWFITHYETIRTALASEDIGVMLESVPKEYGWRLAYGPRYEIHDKYVFAVDRYEGMEIHSVACGIGTSAAAAIRSAMEKI